MKKAIRKLYKAGANTIVVCIPKEAKQALNVESGDDLMFIVDDNNVVTLKKIEV